MDENGHQTYFFPGLSNIHPEGTPAKKVPIIKVDGSTQAPPDINIPSIRIRGDQRTMPINENKGCVVGLISSILGL